MKTSKERGVGSGRMVLGLLLLGAAAPLHAGEFAYGLGYSVSRSDNITRVPVNERSELMQLYLAGFSYLENTADFRARVLAQGSFYDYRDDVFDDEAVYNLNSSLLWTISPQRLTWTLEDAYKETQITTTASDTPANRTNVNVFSTGPDLDVRLNPVNTLAFGARIGNVYTGQANVDSDRLSASARWLYQATTFSTYSVNSQLMDVQYDNPVSNIGYTRRDVFARADYHPSRSQYLIDVGGSKVSPDRGQELDGTLTRLAWVRQMTNESSFGLSASREFADTGTDILAASSSAGLSAGETVSAPANPTSGTVTSDVYYAERVNLFYTHRGSRLGVNFSANTQDLDFETLAQDRKETTGYLGFDFFYSGTTTLKLSTEHSRTEYLDIVRQDTDRNSSVRFIYHLSRSIGLELEGRRTDRASTDPSVDFEENRVFFSILYSSGPLFTPIYTR